MNRTADGFFISNSLELSVEVLLSLHENGESTETCVSGRTEQLTQLFLQILLRGSNRQPLNNKLRHETVSCASQRDTLTNLKAPDFIDILHLICQILKIITRPAASSRDVSFKTAICFNL